MVKETTFLLALAVLVFITSSTSLPAHGQVSANLPEKPKFVEGLRYYFSKIQVTVITLENGSASVEMDLFPVMVHPIAFNISIPYPITLIRIQNISWMPQDNETSYIMIMRENETIVEVHPSGLKTFVELTYLVNEVLEKDNFTWSFSKVTITNELCIKITLPYYSKVGYHSVELSPLPSSVTYQLPVLAMSGPSNLFLTITNMHSLLLRISFEVKNTNTLDNIVMPVRMFMVAIGFSWLIILSLKVYRRRFNLPILVLKNSFRRRGKTFLALFGISALASLISSILVISQVIRTVILPKLGQGSAPSIEPYTFLILGISAASGSFLLVETVLSSVLSRRTELAIMKSIGFKTSSIVKMLIIESAFIGLVAGSVGSVTGTIFGIWPYIKFTKFLDAAPPITELESQITFIFLLATLLSALMIGRRYKKTGIMILLSTFFYTVQFYIFHLLKPFVKIAVLGAAPFLVGCCLFSTGLTIILATIASLYPAYQAGKTKTAEMMRRV